MNYKITSQPASEPMSLSEAKAHLRVSDAEVYDDGYITALIIGARQAVENMTWRALIPQSWKLTLDYAEITKIIGITKCPVISIESVKYIDVNGVQQTMSTNDYQTDINSEPARIRIITMPAIKNQLNAFEINFTCGYSRVLADPVGCTSVDLTTNILTKAAHGLKNSNIIQFTDLGTVTGILLETDYFIINKTTDAFKISATLNGSAIDLTGANTTPPTYQNQQILSVPEQIKSAMKLIIGHLYEHREEVTMAQFYNMPMAASSLLDPYKLNWFYPYNDVS